MPFWISLTLIRQGIESFIPVGGIKINETKNEEKRIKSEISIFKVI